MMNLEHPHVLAPARPCTRPASADGEQTLMLAPGTVPRPMGYRRVSAKVSWGQTTATPHVLLQVMELAPPGLPCTRLIVPAPTPPLALALLCLFLRQVAGAMAYLGARGLVHRDLGPTRNLLLSDRAPSRWLTSGWCDRLGGARAATSWVGPAASPLHGENLGGRAGSEGRS